MMDKYIINERKRSPKVECSDFKGVSYIVTGTFDTCYMLSEKSFSMIVDHSIPCSYFTETE